MEGKQPALVTKKAESHIPEKQANRGCHGAFRGLDGNFSTVADEKTAYRGDRNQRASFFRYRTEWCPKDGIFKGIGHFSETNGHFGGKLVVPMPQFRQLRIRSNAPAAEPVPPQITTASNRRNPRRLPVGHLFHRHLFD